MSASKNSVFEKAAVAIFFLLLSYVVIYKAIHVPITHDEKAASVYYPTWPVTQVLMSDVWPSNHILNTLLIKLSESTFGIEPWSVRLPNILAFVLFFLALWVIAKHWFSRGLLFSLPFFIVFCNPFLLDFFGLARGYGLSNAFMACSITSLLFFSNSFKLQWYYLAIVFAMLAAYANFTLLIYWVAVQMLLVSLYLFHAFKTRYPISKVFMRLSSTALIALAFIALCYVPLYKMQSTNQFIYWSKESFYKDTVLSQVNNFLYGAKYARILWGCLIGLIFTALSIAALYSLYKFITSRQIALSNPVVVLSLLLFLVWLVNIIQAIVLGTPFLTNRTGLSYYVLFAFLLMFVLRELTEYFPQFGYVSFPVITILAIAHLYFTVRLDSVREWSYDSDTYHILGYLKDYQLQHPEIKTIALNTSWIYNPSFSFYSITGKTPWLNLTEYHKEVDTASQTLFYYATHDDSWQLNNYSPALDFPNNCGVLMIRIEKSKATISSH
jgi:hypothetical protein